MEQAAFVAHDPSFSDILGSSPSLELLIEKDYAFAHEAGVFIPSTNELFITSNRLLDDPSGQRVEISKLKIDPAARSVTCEKLPVTGVKKPNGEIDHEQGIFMGNGGVNYKESVLFCAQGTMEKPSGLFTMSVSPPHEIGVVALDFYGRPFNSVNDVVVHSDGSIWFTDPTYGFEQSYRPKPSLPDQVYRYDPTTKNIRVVADGFGHPNGLCFSPDEKIMYVTDTARVNGNGTIDDGKPSTIYAFDVQYYSGSPFLVNRRVFAMADSGIPDGIKCDLDGNVYSGCGDGLHAWSPGGVLLGRIQLVGGVANFCFGQPGEIFLLNETKVWRARISPKTRGALLRL